MERHHKAGRTVLLIGHAGHPEVLGTTGQVPEGTVILIEAIEDAECIAVPDPERVAFSTQTTLSVSDTSAIVAILRRRFPAIEGPRGEDICYATSNRQQAVAALASQVDLVLVVGAPNSSNSRRLVEVALRAGCPKAELIQDARDLDETWLDGVATLGLTAGASAPEILVQEVVGRLGRARTLSIEDVQVVDERVYFRPPPAPRRPLPIAS